MSLRNNMSSIRSQLGVCPQHDILFDLLTVTEHLEMYAAIKGIPASVIPHEVHEMINLVGLTEKAHSQSASLSGNCFHMIIWLCND
jgi:ABC-type multidrug transport system ATPase subunit